MIRDPIVVLQDFLATILFLGPFKSNEQWLIPPLNPNKSPC